MLPDRVSSPGPPTYELGALPIELRGPAVLEHLRTVCFQRLYKAEEKNRLLINLIIKQEFSGLLRLFSPASSKLTRHLYYL